MKYSVRLPDTSDSYKVRLPDAGNSYKVRMPEIGINLDKVLIVANSDVTLSMDIADYYITKRGLNATHRINKALGTNDTVVGGTDGATPQTFYTNVVLPVANYIETNGIEAVICSARVPHLVDCIDDGYAQRIATSSCLGAAVFIRDEEGGMVRAQTNYFSVPTIETDGDESLWFLVPGDKQYGSSESKELDSAFFDFRASRARAIIPYGRIGLPKHEAAVPAETQLETQRMIDDAFAQDGVGAAGGTIHFGYRDRAEPWITGHQGERARQFAGAEGIPTKHFVQSYSADWPAAPPEDYSYADVIAGTLNEDAFGLLGAAISEEPFEAPYKDSFNFLQGCWAFEATSSSDNLVATVINNGGCAGICTIAEPFANGTVKQDLLMRNLLQGRSLCEAALMSGARYPWMVDIWGDPLYTPYSCAEGIAETVKNWRFEDWTAGDPDFWNVDNADATHTFTEDVNGGRYSIDTTTPVLQVEQTLDLEEGEDYRILIEIAERVSGTLKIDITNQANPVVSAINDERSYFARFTATALNRITIYRNTANTNMVIRSVSVKKVC